jgi:predicted  nucleic acid-binding Zn-ribbon protein
MYTSGRELSEELLQRIEDMQQRIEDMQQQIDEGQQRIEEALQQKPDRDEVETWRGWIVDELKDELSNVASILAGEEDLEHGVLALQHQIEDMHSQIVGEVEDLKFKLKYSD